MYRHYNSKLQMDVVIIHPGEFFSTKDDIIISTVLGSCVAVAFWDKFLHFGGLNHFMLPGDTSREGGMFSETGKYGMFAMELLINEMIKNGSKRENLVAKVFGGGHVLRDIEQNGSRVPQSNIEFALNYLQTEKIPVEKSDVGGFQARKIFFYPKSNRILLKRITGKLITSVESEEKQYFEKIRKEKEEKQKQKKVTFF